MIDLSRAEWGARPSKQWRPRVAHTHVELHHSVSPYDVSTVAAAQQIQNFHMDTNGWNDIFYNLFIHRGLIVEGRGVGTRSTGDALTVCVIGNYEHDRLRPEDHAAIERVLRAFPNKLPAAETFPDYHQARYLRTGRGHPSACPGRNIIDLIHQGAFAPSKEDDPLADAEQAIIDRIDLLERRVAQWENDTRKILMGDHEDGEGSILDAVWKNRRVNEDLITNATVLDRDKLRPETREVLDNIEREHG